MIFSCYYAKLIILKFKILTDTIVSSRKLNKKTKILHFDNIKDLKKLLKFNKHNQLKVTLNLRKKISVYLGGFIPSVQKKHRNN